jgi:hypothetical protein
MGSFKNLPENHCAIFNQTWGINHTWGRGLNFVQMKGIYPLKGEIIAKE